MERERERVKKERDLLWKDERRVQYHDLKQTGADGNAISICELLELFRSLL